MKPVRICDVVIKYLLDSIMRGEIPLGGKLPSTENLAKLTGTSIISAREAMKNLAWTGIVEICHGRGMFLTEGLPIMEDLLEARMVIESNSALKAAGKLDGAAQEKIEQMLQRMEEHSKEGDVEGFSEMDYEFHIYISKLAGSRILSRSLENIKELLYYQQSSINRLRPGIIKQSLIRHRELFAALKDGDAPLAASTMTQHIAEVIEFWKTSQSGSAKEGKTMLQRRKE
ncbi:MAG: FadR/GntR family transcriptional regulator [Syntrophales bacterium]